MVPLIDPSKVLGVLQGFNPWWRGASFPVPGFRRLAFQACRRYLLDESLRRAILLSGPRRVGKTTILLQIAQDLIASGHDPKGILYLSLDHPILKLLPFSEVLATYHEAIQAEDRHAFLLLDEVQYAQDWETEVKLLVDHRPNLRILATVSASVVHTGKLAESGVGRWITVPIPTLSFFEFTSIRGEAKPEISPELRLSGLFAFTPSAFSFLAARFTALLPVFHRYLLVGGFPETATREDIGLCQRLLREDIVERVLKRDMTALFRVRNINDLEKLFIYLCLNTGGILSKETCAEALGVNTATLSNYLELLEQANLVYCLPPTSRSGKRVLKARNKYYLVDAALRNAVLLRGEEILADQEEMGCIVETTVLRHLFAYYYPESPSITYWRDPASKKEVDIVVSSPSSISPFEVKYRNNPELRRDGGLAVFSQAEGVRRGYFVTKNDKDFGLAMFDGISTVFLKVPAHILTYLLGQSEHLLWK